MSAMDRRLVAILITVLAAVAVLAVYFSIKSGIDRQSDALMCQTIQFIDPSATCPPPGWTPPRGVAPVDEVTAWTRSPNFTTCDQWASEMTESQRIQMARDLLPILRMGVDSAAPDGSEMAADFAVAIGRTCRKPEVVALGEYVITAAATLAFLDDSRFHP